MADDQKLVEQIATWRAPLDAPTLRLLAHAAYIDAANKHFKEFARAA